jgi:hypothetical protein
MSLMKKEEEKDEVVLHDLDPNAKQKYLYYISLNIHDKNTYNYAMATQLTLLAKSDQKLSIWPTQHPS